MQIIGESINSSIPQVGKAIQERDISFLVALAREQKDAGADMLDVHVGSLSGNEAETLTWLVQTIQAEVDIPLVLDSLNAQAVEAALAVHRGHTIINSLSGEQERWQQLMPLVIKHNCGAVMLCMGESGIPATAQERLGLAQELVKRALVAGVKPQDLYLDPLAPSIGADWQGGKVTMETIRLIHQNIPDVHTICAISNISFGLPRRHLLNASFSAMAIAMGLDTFLIDVRDKAMMTTILAANALAGNDRHSLKYLRAYRAGRLQV